MARSLRINKLLLPRGSSSEAAPVRKTSWFWTNCIKWRTAGIGAGHYVGVRSGDIFALVLSGTPYRSTIIPSPLSDTNRARVERTSCTAIRTRFERGCADRFSSRATKAS